ncbi:hypothetical protein PXK17_17995 [Phaeobacter gallaeciensis]|uniref:DNA-binding protein n=1 Tax=Phaeobacter gallaeciensis TaxID=60890 RepID=A0ABD4XDW6_9RHOB|nr:hypothetical protein [Phaeobacter gallaeciensis]MDE4146439.1 hypothetical protein [Phaeobacter gallaeciensis]MDE4159197.1 hypothetical protein [Phaeobacter gallaeciensis]MDE4163374.1 hypothetical protein [Phaeobacter gallaeciensis]MDE4167519.1 hypothetical protein [Phaeobacter gallaeciensis]MDE4171753.1 hypothetical protein [Phaeobacter gallaeciensis]
MTYTTISQIARRWRVDRATARIALADAEIPTSDFHTSPRYHVGEILRKIENLPDDLHHEIDLKTPLLRADELADHLGVTPQTVRNYGQAGRLHVVKLTKHTARYMLPPMRKCKSETKTADPDQR